METRLPKKHLRRLQQLANPEGKTIMIDESDFYDETDFMTDEALQELEIKKAIGELIRQKNNGKRRDQ
jgi:hypothetical protein